MRDHKSQPPERKPGWPEGDDDVINKYGTYEIQRTNGMENPYPMIAQGISPQEAQEQLEAARQWKEKKWHRHEESGSGMEPPSLTRFHTQPKKFFTGTSRPRSHRLTHRKVPWRSYTRYSPAASSGAGRGLPLRQRRSCRGEGMR